MNKLYKHVTMSLVLAAFGFSFLTLVPSGTASADMIIDESPNDANSDTGTGISCSILPQAICNKAKDGTSQGGVFELLKWILTIMTALVGFAAVGGLIWAGILYASASANAEQVKKAKTIIRDVIIGLVAYGLMFIILNWLIPGGVLS